MSGGISALKLCIECFLTFFKLLHTKIHKVILNAIADMGFIPRGWRNKEVVLKKMTIFVEKIKNDHLIMSSVLKYIVRAVKYFFYFTILLIIIMTVLVLAHVLDGNISTMFRNGYDSLWQIALMFAAISSVYPIFGFVKKEALIPGEYAEVRDGVVKYMEDKGYRLEKEEGENLTFRNRSFLNRLSRMLEDRITLTRTLGGFEVEGLRKDAIRIIYGLENALRKTE